MKQFLLLASVFLLASCVSIERNNPDDPESFLSSVRCVGD